MSLFIQTIRVSLPNHSERKIENRMKALEYLLSLTFTDQMIDNPKFAMRVVGILVEMVNTGAELDVKQRVRLHQMVLSFSAKNAQMDADDDEYITLELVPLATYINSCKL